MLENRCGRSDHGGVEYRTRRHIVIVSSLLMHWSDDFDFRVKIGMCDYTREPGARFNII